VESARALARSPTILRLHEAARIVACQGFRDDYAYLTDELKLGAQQLAITHDFVGADVQAAIGRLVALDRRRSPVAKHSWSALVAKHRMATKLYFARLCADIQSRRLIMFQWRLGSVMAKVEVMLAWRIECQMPLPLVVAKALLTFLWPPEESCYQGFAAMDSGDFLRQKARDRRRAPLQRGISSPGGVVVRPRVVTAMKVVPGV
jgi:hypothetical protein